MSPFPTVATSKTPKMEIRKARPSGDSHGLAYFHLRRLIPCRRKEIMWYSIQNRTGLLRNLEDAVEFLAQCRHILSDFIVGNSGIDLGRGDAFMPQHLADRFQRYALRERNRLGEGMPRAMDRGVERQTGVSGNMP